MIRAVCFDWFNTLACYHPPREELHSQVLGEFGIKLSPPELIPAILAADRYFYEENALSPVEKRNPEEKAQVDFHYYSKMFTEARVKVDKGLIPKIIARGRQLSQGMRFTLFDDVLPTLKELKRQKLVLGLLSNIDRDMKPICHELGMEPYIDFIVTSGDVGFDKPNPPIFLAALQQAGVNASEAVHVGDQYKLDVIGARGVGITPILIDRYDLYPEVSDCPRISSLTELSELL